MNSEKQIRTKCFKLFKSTLNIDLQDDSSTKKIDAEEKFRALESLYTSELKSSTHKSDTNVDNANLENNGRPSQISENSSPKIGPNHTQEISFQNNSTTSSIRSLNKANYSSENTAGHKNEGNIPDKFPNGMNGFPPPPIPPRSATRHLDNVSNIQQ